MHLLIKASLIGMALSATFKPRSCSYVDSSGNCQTCNLNLGYYNDGSGGCNSHFSTKCAFLDHNGNCLSCKDGMAPSGPFCLKSSPVANCQFYQPGADGICLYCNDNYYLSGNTCIPVTNIIPNCIYYPTDKVCAQCKTGYIVKNSACVSAISNCLVQSGPRCVGCAANTFLVPVSTISTVQDKTFWSYLFQVNKLGWSATQQSTSTTCVSNADCNCGLPSSPTTCVACRENYYLASNGLCTPIPANLQGTGCAAYNTTSSGFVCDTCKKGYYMSNGACAPNPVLQKVARCTYYSTPGQCSRCESGFSFNGINCVPAPATIANCVVYGFGNTCQYCNLTANTYSLQGACQNLTDQDYSHCTAHNAQGCAACDAGYTLDATKHCVVVSNPPYTNCGRYSTASTCAECPQGYFMSGQGCYPVADANCEYFKSSGICDYCKNGFFMNTTTNTCDAGTSVANCLAMYSAGLCAYCADNFYLNTAQTACIAAPATDCKSYLNNTSCGVCTEPKYYDPVTNTCKTSATTITDCYRFATETTCLQCGNNKYVSSTGTCIARPSSPAAITDCTAMGTDPAKCVLCGTALSHYTLSANGATCSGTVTTALTNCDFFGTSATNTEICIECAAGYYLSADGTSCTAILANLPASNCASYSSTVVSNAVTALPCARCSGDYHLDNAGSCAAASPAVVGCGFYGTDGTCKYCSTQKRLVAAVVGPPAVAASCATYTTIPNCMIYTAFNVCSQCLPGFTPSADGSSCTVSAGTSTSQCARYSTAAASLTTCIECADGYYLQNNLCVAFNTSLSNCKYQTGPYTCGVCLDNFYLDNGVCKSVAANTVVDCAEYSSASACSLCKPGFALSNNQCQALTGIPGCHRYSDASTCALCEAEYYLSSGKCLPVTTVISNCTTYANDTACSACMNGTALLPNGSACLTNCETAGANGCTKCGPLAFLSNGACSLVTNFVDNCMYYSANGVCSLCIQDHVLANNVCTRLSESVNCKELEDATPTCSLCAPGFRVSGGLCVANPASTTTNCLASDSTGACIMCAPNYYHDRASGNCVSIFNMG